jgi:hypothetical protein
MIRRLAILSLIIACVFALAAGAADTSKFSASALQVAGVSAEDNVTLPLEFRVALYENMIEGISKTGRFAHIYRDGEKPADPSTTVTLRSTVTGFKEGSARARQVTTVSGATKIKVHVEFVDGSGKVLLARDVDGNVYFMGENLRATYNFSKSVAKIVNDSFQKPAGTAAAPAK